MHGVLYGQHISRRSNLSVVTCEYELMDIDVAMTGYASDFWEVRKLSINFPLYSRVD